MSPPHLVRRKLATFAATIRACENWPAVARARLSASASVDALHFRDGRKLRPMPPLKETWGEIFEPAIADLYGIRAARPDFIIDVGANIGAFTCLAAHVHPHAQVHAFEPSPPHADRLAENVALNRLGNVVLHRKAVTKDGRTVVFSQFGAGGASGIVLQGDGPSPELESVSLGTIDFTPGACRFLKLDCEGSEGEIIEWLCANLSHLPARVKVACEYHHWCPLSLDDLLHLLRPHGSKRNPASFTTRSTSSPPRTTGVNP